MNGMALCAGVGGLERGLSLADPEHRTVLWCEYDQRAAATLVSNFGKGLDAAPVWDDIRTLDGRPWRGVVDLISAGFPCQPFSDAGNKRGEADERHLWPHVLRIIREAQPRFVFLENVPGILSTHSTDGRPAAIVVRQDLEGLGFRVEEGLFSAEEVGAPHRRVRWFLVADAGRSGDERRAGPGGDGETAGQGESEGAERERLRDPARTEGHNVADNDGEGRRGERIAGLRHGTRRDHAHGRDEELGHPESVGRERGRLGDQERRPKANKPEHGHGTLADSGGERSQGICETWPPKPDDSEGWAEYLDRYPYATPATESSIRGDPDGVAAGMDVCLCSRRERLKQCGNGVVPQTAALAWATLS